MAEKKWPSVFKAKKKCEICGAKIKGAPRILSVGTQRKVTACDGCADLARKGSDAIKKELYIAKLSKHHK